MSIENSSEIFCCKEKQRYTSKSRRGMGSQKSCFAYFYDGGITACLSTDGNQLVEKERLVKQEREVRLVEVLLFSGMQGTN